MAEYLVELGIDSISLNPDTVLETTRQVLEVEQRLGRAPRGTTGTQELLTATSD
jgi:pyruvate,water dikinase